MAALIASDEYKELASGATNLRMALAGISTKYLAFTEDAPLNASDLTSIGGLVASVARSLVRVAYAALDESSAKAFGDGLRSGLGDWANRGLNQTSGMWREAHAPQTGPGRGSSKYGPGGHAPDPAAVEKRLEHFRHDRLQAISAEAKAMALEVDAYWNAIGQPAFAQVLPLANVLATLCPVVRSSVALAEANANKGEATSEHLLTVIDETVKAIGYALHPGTGPSVSHRQMMEVGGYRVNPHHKR